MGAYLVHYINIRLSIISTEISDLPDLIIVREDVYDQMDAFMHMEGAANQLLPGWRVRGICNQSKSVIQAVW